MVQVVTAEELNNLSVKVDTTLDLLKTFLLVSGQKAVVTVKDIARNEGVSESFLRSASGCYLLPRYGVSAYPDASSARWDIDEYIKWRAIDPTLRKESQRHRKTV